MPVTWPCPSNTRQPTWIWQSPSEISGRSRHSCASPAAALLSPRIWQSEYRSPLCRSTTPIYPCRNLGYRSLGTPALCTGVWWGCRHNVSGRAVGASSQTRLDWCMLTLQNLQQPMRDLISIVLTTQKAGNRELTERQLTSKGGRQQVNKGCLTFTALTQCMLGLRVRTEVDRPVHDHMTL